MRDAGVTAFSPHELAYLGLLTQEQIAPGRLEA